MTGREDAGTVQGCRIHAQITASGGTFHMLERQESGGSRPVLEPLFDPRNPDLDPNGDAFPWGPIDRVINFGRYSFVEYRFDKSGFKSSDYSDHGGTFYQVYVDGRSTAHSFSTLDEAVVFAVAYRAEGANTQAATYFMKMIATSTKGETQS